MLKKDTPSPRCIAASAETWRGLLLELLRALETTDGLCRIVPRDT